MCSGRVDLEFVLRAFLNGMDGVFIGGCHLGECNYITHGNYQALSMTLLAKRIMEHLGMNPERLRISFMSGGEGNLYTETIDDFSKNVRGLGPLGQPEGLDLNELKQKIRDVIKLIPYIKIMMREKLEARLTDKGDYETHYTAEEIESLFRDAASYHIDPEKCQACGICLRRCPMDAIEGGKNMVHVIDQDKCIKCGTCLEACPPKFGAVQKVVGAPVPLPPPPEARVIQRKAKQAPAA